MGDGTVNRREESKSKIRSKRETDARFRVPMHGRKVEETLSIPPHLPALPRPKRGRGWSKAGRGGFVTVQGPNAQPQGRGGSP